MLVSSNIRGWRRVGRSLATFAVASVRSEQEPWRALGALAPARDHAAGCALAAAAAAARHVRHRVERVCAALRACALADGGVVARILQALGVAAQGTVGHRRCCRGRRKLADRIRAIRSGLGMGLRGDLRVAAATAATAAAAAPRTPTRPSRRQPQTPPAVILHPTGNRAGGGLTKLEELPARRPAL